MHPGEGPVPAKIMLVGEAFGADEERAGRPFVGASGSELNRMLGEAGILRSEVYVTNLVNARPTNNYLGHWIALTKKDRTPAHLPLRDKWVLPIVIQGFDSLQREIEQVQPNVIITVGNYAMWALTGKFGILKWRGSVLRLQWPSLEDNSKQPVVIPTVHPAAVLREWSYRALAVQDLKRAASYRHTREVVEPVRNFTIRPSYNQVQCVLMDMIFLLEHGELWIDFDIETRAGHIACIGISWSAADAICVPLMCAERREGYWSEDEEAAIVFTLYRVLTHANARVRWQNGLYDAQYTYRHWHFVPRGAQDTMISAHSCFAALPKGLGFLASMHAKHYVYWKDEGKTWDKNTGEDQLWRYNLLDCVYTREVGESLAETARGLGLAGVDAVQQRLFWPVLRAMQLGVRVLPDARNKLANDIQAELSAREDFLTSILGHPINVGSSVQMQKLFYEDLQQKVVWKRKLIQGKMESRPTCDDDALSKIAVREPILKPVCNAIADIRTLGKWLNDFVLMQRDLDGRMRCSFNIAGDAGGKSAPYSYRLSSSENAFGSGGNLQTIPSEKSKSAGKAAARGSMDFALPNIRSMYGPDPGFTFFDLDLDRADLQVVVWEADDAMLKAALRLGVDIHLLNVYTLDNREPPPLEELVESHSRYMDHRGPRKHQREFSKVFCHATNYVGSAKTVAEHTGRSIQEVDRAQKLWFGAHPGIKRWHERTLAQITKHRFVENRFGFKWFIFDRLDNLLPEAVAWVPQSTVGILINRIWLAIHDNAPEIMTLLQVHDSLCGQFPTHKKAACMEALKSLSAIVIPYDDPLIIPTGIKTSEVSWGDCL